MPSSTADTPPIARTGYVPSRCQQPRIGNRSRYARTTGGMPIYASHAASPAAISAASTASSPSPSIRQNARASSTAAAETAYASLSIIVRFPR
jgi:hypothetical protein